MSPFKRSNFDTDSRKTFFWFDEIFSSWNSDCRSTLFGVEWIVSRAGFTNSIKKNVMPFERLLSSGYLETVHFNLMFLRCGIEDVVVENREVRCGY